MKYRFAFCLSLLAGPSTTAASPQSLSLVLPVNCQIGATCLVQKLVDHDPGPGRQDYHCGTLTTDGHDGIDIRLRTMADMKAGYAVVAAAAGQVLRTRDGEPDISSRQHAVPDGREAGNGVVVDHGNGWLTQYSHLLQGSVSVHPGQRVAVGERLGLVGMSGNAEFPHLHFTVRHAGKIVDPFVGTNPAQRCGDTGGLTGLWTTGVARALTYKPTALIMSGLASKPPPRAVADRPGATAPDGPQAPLLLWVDLIGARPGDTQEFRIVGPSAKLVHEANVTIADGGLSWFAYSGKRAPQSGWPKGRYLGRYTLRRDGQLIIQSEVSEFIR